MVKSFSLAVIITIFLSRPFVTCDPHHGLRRDIVLQRSVPDDPCNRACHPIQQALKDCGPGSDTFCGCDAWIKDTARCSACTVVNGNSTFNGAGTLNQLIRAFCLCATDCKAIAQSAFTCGFHSQQAHCVCPSVQGELAPCTTCVHEKDPFSAEVVKSYLAQLC